MWGVASPDLNVTLLARGADEATAAHVNAERDVLLVVLEGDGLLELGDERHELGPLTATLIEKGLRRRVVPGPAGIRYLSVHLARGGLQIAPRLRRET
jgi:mannose-6-phosphate isomerase-like protein (cupin superfamily)